MGSCLSKKTNCSPAATQSAPEAKEKAKPEAVKSVVEEAEFKKEVEEPSLLKKDIFIIKHRKAHDNKSIQPQPQPQPQPQNVPKPLQPQEDDVVFASTANSTPTTSAAPEMVNNITVRTSSCTKEEVDAILIQCGRLSRSNSTGKTTGSSARKYSGSKRSYDFDHNDQDQEVDIATAARYDAKKKLIDDEDGSGDGADDDEKRQHRPPHRHHRDRSQGRRRTPSRERDQNQRSGSRERGNGSSGSGSGRRVSRSPARRSETVPSTNASNRPAKLVSVPATVTVDKSNNIGVDNQPNTTIKRNSVKRSVAEAAGRSAASPRSQSPAKTSIANSQQQQQPSLSRSSSRKTDQSPCRRNPLAEIDPNKPTSVNRQQIKSKENEEQVMVKESVNLLFNQASMPKPHSETNSGQGINGKGSRIGLLDNKGAKEQQPLAEDAKRQPPVTAESMKPPQMVTRSRSARRSQDLDINPETLSYTTLLLEDIQNFHQKNTPAVSLPPCLTKACSILEAVADLNSTTSSNLSSAFFDDRSPPITATNLVGKKLSEAKDPFVESEILVSNDLLEPSFHKYVTVRRSGTVCGEDDMDGEESSGSNSFVAGSQQQHWGVSSNTSWEPNSADSTDRWTSRSNTTAEEDKKIPQVFERVAALPQCPGMEDGRRGLTGQRTVIGRERRGTTTQKNLQSTPLVARTAST